MLERKPECQDQHAPGRLTGLDSVGSQWSPRLSYLLLAALTVLCLVPFSGAAFRIDDPLFLWAARQIAAHPLDPYGFQVVWYDTVLPMSEVTKNPPLASYYIAMVGALAGSSERVIHLAFLLPALGVVLGTYHLARRFSRFPLLVALATLLTPGFLVSAGTVMSDIMMLAFWILAVILWIEGLESEKPLFLGAAGLLMAASALTKYFGISLIPLLLIYSLVRKRRLGPWAWYFLPPVLLLIFYQFWTGALYGRGLLLDAAAYANVQRGLQGASVLGKALVSIGFIGGCMLPALMFAPLLWSRKRLLGGIVLSCIAGLAIGKAWMDSGAPIYLRRGELIGAQLGFFIAGGCCVLALAAEDFRKRRDADSLLLSLWVLGTMLFAGFFNWTINARSVLPLLPAAGILLARRLEVVLPASTRALSAKLLLPLVVSGLLSLWVAWADADLANSARRAAELIHEKDQSGNSAVWFQGHWGFQYYMESFGARPVYGRQEELRAGDLMVIPENNTNTYKVKPDLVSSTETIELEISHGISTMRSELAAGFYTHSWGPLPFGFGRVPLERYFLLRLK